MAYYYVCKGHDYEGESVIWIGVHEGAGVAFLVESVNAEKKPSYFETLSLYKHDGYEEYRNGDRTANRSLIVEYRGGKLEVGE